MDFMEYREKLGMGYCEDKKFEYFFRVLFNKLEILSKGPTRLRLISSDEYVNFCNLTGIPICYDVLGDTVISDMKRYQLCLAVFREHESDFLDFISYFLAFVNSITPYCYFPTYHSRNDYANILKAALEMSHIPFCLMKHGNEYLVLPKGTAELDEALVAHPLGWLADYPIAQKTYATALKQYADGVYIRDVADNLRKALEAFLQEFLRNEKNLETNKNEICKYLGSRGVDAGIGGLFQSLINAYKSINDRIAKHNDKVDKKLLEFLLYQTGILIRMVFVVSGADESGNNN